MLTRVNIRSTQLLEVQRKGKGLREGLFAQSLLTAGLGLNVAFLFRFQRTALSWT